MTSEVRNSASDWHLELLKDYTSTYEDDEYRNSFSFQEPHQEPQPGTSTVHEWVPFEGQIFNTDDDAYEFYNVFARKNGFSIRRDRICKSHKNESEDNPSGVYKREFVCHRAGIVKQRKVDEVKNQRKRKSSRCSCSAKLLVSKGFEGKWVVKYFNNNHNHELLDDKEVQFLPAYRNIPIDDQNRILLLSKAGCSVSLIMRVLELEKSIDTGNLPFLEKDIRNFIQSHSGIDKENDASDVLKLCKILKDMDSAFEYDFTIDESNKLEHIIWAFGDSIQAYESFGDVVVFDTTYRINRYDMPLGMWIGVDNHGNSIFFGCVLLRNEKKSSFRWALKSFLTFVEGKYPQTILTDQDLALTEAIAKELPNTKHAFCIWHIVAKLSSWFSFPLGSRYIDFKQEFHRVYHLESIDDFEREWELMVAQFGLSKDDHIDLLYSHRQFWGLAYLKDYFFVGMTTTGRSESINSYVKRFLDVKTSTLYTAELEKFLRQIKGMPASQDNLIYLEPNVPDVPNNDGYDVENLVVSKSKGRPKGSRPKGGVEAAKKLRRCHVPNCGGTNHDSRNCPNKKKNIEVLPSQSPNKITKGWRQSSSNVQ